MSSNGFKKSRSGIVESETSADLKKNRRDTGTDMTSSHRLKRSDWKGLERNGME